MDFEFTPAQQAFRTRLRAWMERTVEEVFGSAEDALGPSPESLLFTRDDGRWAQALEYHRRLLAAGYLALHWPTEWGGGGAGPVEQLIYQDEALRLGLPLFGANNFAIDRIGPTLMRFGSDEQKRRFLTPMLTGEEIWCQGYSEPNAGSDLAAIQTRAVLDGDEFVINGQKTWTSLAHRARWQAMLARTDPTAARHKGVTYLLVDLASPGVTIRPLRQMTGESGFNEIFYDNVRAPRANAVGAVNDGWRVAMAMMGYQRASAGSRHPVERGIAELAELARRVEFGGMLAARHPYVRQTLAQFAIEARCLRLGRYRSLTGYLKGRPPGPEGSFAKLSSSELNLRVAMFAAEMLGGLATLTEGSPGALERGRWAHRILEAREFTIAGGTSEIQRNIIGERVLMLPKS